MALTGAAAGAGGPSRTAGREQIVGSRRNLTLAIDEDLLERARIAAARKRTTVTRMVREYLTSIAQEDVESERAIARLEARMANPPLAVGATRWTRDELHER